MSETPSRSRSAALPCAVTRTARLDPIRTTHWLLTNFSPNFAPATPAGGDLAEALRRVRAYVDAGADGVFIPGIADPREITAVVAAVDVPVNVLFLPGRNTVASLADLGVRRISTGSLLYRAALAAAVDIALSVRDGDEIRADLPSYDETNRLLTGGPHTPAGGMVQRTVEP